MLKSNTLDAKEIQIFINIYNWFIEQLKQFRIGLNEMSNKNVNYDVMLVF